MQLRKVAATWGEKYTTDDDIAADLVLVDKFLANLRAKGASEATELASCPNADNPYPDGPYPHGDGGTGLPTMGEPHHHGCSTGGAPGGLVLGLAVLGLAIRRRRA